jgi:hypothetical protein
LVDVEIVLGFFIIFFQRMGKFTKIFIYKREVDRDDQYSRLHG